MSYSNSGCVAWGIIVVFMELPTRTVSWSVLLDTSRLARTAADANAKHFEDRA